MVPFVHIAIKLIGLRLLLVLEKEIPELISFTSLLNDLNLSWSPLIFLQDLNISIGFVHVWSQVTIWHITSLPNEDWVRALIFVTRLNDEHRSWIKNLAFFAKIKIIHQQSARNFIRIFRLMGCY